MVTIAQFLKWNITIPLICYFNPYQFKKKAKNIEIISMRNGYIIDVLTSVVIQEIVKLRGEVIEIHEGVI